MDGHALSTLRDELLADPYAVYSRLREDDPVHWSESWNAWFLTRFADVEAAIKDPRLRVGRVRDFTQRVVGFDTARIERTLESWLLFQDPPLHDRVRPRVSRAFTPRTIQRMEEAVTKRVEALLGRVADDDTVDLIERLASPLPVLTVADMLAGDSPMPAAFHGWSHDLASFLGGDALDARAAAAAEAAMRGLEQWFGSVIRERKAHPADDLVSSLLNDDDGALPDEDILALCTLLFAAGHDTTTNLIGNGLLAVLRHADARARLLDDPQRISSAVEEMLRYDSPSQVVSRYAAADVEVGGRVIREGQIVNLCIGAANRDPAQFLEPDRFDVERTPNRHLSFGRGIHTCLGAFLARQEARIAIGMVLARWPHAALAEEPKRWPTLGFRRLRSLRVRTHARAAAPPTTGTTAPDGEPPRTVVRLARVDDIAFVRVLARQSIVHGIPPGRDATPDEVRQHVANSYADLERTFNQSRDFVILIAEAASERVGYIMLDFAQVEPATGERQCFIVDLAVQPGRWGQGTTHQLIEKSAKMTKARGLKYLVGHVSANNTRTLGIAQGALDFTVERCQIMKRCD